jgi:glycosyltransferase involved in cell wall biosynthesis
MPAISIITAVRNGLPLLERAIRSIQAQTFADWEWLVVDDGSTDGTYDAIGSWAAEDPRIRPLRHDQNRGTAAARNTALRAARGEFITYLDHDDEYYPDYLAQVVQLQDQSDVLVFGYDMIHDDGDAKGRQSSWDPSQVRGNLFLSCIVTPLGVAHRRSLAEQLGGFNELLWHDEGTDFWRRLARRGARFVYLYAKSGRYRVRGNSLSRIGQPKPHQRETLERNWRNGRPIFESQPGPDLESDDGTRLCSAHPTLSPLAEREGTRIANPLPQTLSDGGTSLCSSHPTISSLAKGPGVRKVAFVSPHCVLDFTNGAATATLDGLALLARSGFECQAFCNSRMDAWEEVRVEEILAKRQVPYEAHNAQIGAYQARMIFTTHENVPVTLFNSASTRGTWINDEEIAAFLTACEIFLAKNRPDVVWTYGGDPVSLAVQQLAKRLDIPILFALHNFGYRDTAAFQMADYVIVPTEFCRQFYWDTIGLACLKLPLVVDSGRVSVGRGPQADPKPDGGTRLCSSHPTISPLTDSTDGGTRLCSAHPTISPLPVGEEGLSPRYVTLVNPEPRKGIHVFARIAEVLARQRPDIPLLVVEGAARTNYLSQLGIDLGGLRNVQTMPNSPDARGFHAVTKILLMPSLMENAGLVAMEAMINGIPVVASNRGGLPETIGEAGFLFDIPARYTPETRDIPTAEEVEPWVETIIRLWDDTAEHERWSKAARERSQQWHPDRLAPIYRDFFGGITHQPGPPLVPRGVGGV